MRYEGTEMWVSVILGMWVIDVVTYQKQQLYKHEIYAESIKKYCTYQDDKRGWGSLSGNWLMKVCGYCDGS